MNDRILQWDERFARGEELHGHAASPPLAAAVEGVPPGLALDLACGAGRHAIFLAQRGWRVLAVDGSREALSRLSAEARARGVEAAIETQASDLEAPGFSLEAASFDLVCDFYFLHRPLLDQVRSALRPGGRFVAAIHVRTSPGEKGRFLLEPGELRALCESWGWEVLHYREGAPGEGGHSHGAAELIARRPQEAPAEAG